MKKRDICLRCDWYKEEIDWEWIPLVEVRLSEGGGLEFRGGSPRVKNNESLWQKDKFCLNECPYALEMELANQGEGDEENNKV